MDLINANLKPMRPFVWVCTCELMDMLLPGSTLFRIFFYLTASALALFCCWGGLAKTMPQHLASLTQNASSSSSCRSGFSLLLQRAESSDEPEQAEALRVNKAVDWRLRANSTASQLQEKRNSPVLSFLSGYFNFPSSFLWRCDVEKKLKCLFPHLECYKRVSSGTQKHSFI